MRFNK